MTRLSRTLLLCLALLLAGLLAPLGSAQAAAGPGTVSARTALPPVEVRVGQEGAVGRFGSVTVPVLYRCQRPWIVAGLYVQASQGGVTGRAFRSAGLTCDAAWHRVVLEAGSGTGEPFLADYADIDVTVDIQDPISFDPVEQATASARIWIAPAARIRVEGAVLHHGAVLVTVAARCQRPWVVQQFSASVSQRRGFVFGAVSASTGLTCDAAWHRITLRVRGAESFVRGPARVEAGLFVLDPVDFDPVDADSSSRTFLLHR